MGKVDCSYVDIRRSYSLFQFDLIKLKVKYNNKNIDIYTVQQANFNNNLSSSLKEQNTS